MDFPRNQCFSWQIRDFLKESMIFLRNQCFLKKSLILLRNQWFLKKSLVFLRNQYFSSRILYFLKKAFLFLRNQWLLLRNHRFPLVVKVTAAHNYVFTFLSSPGTLQRARFLSPGHPKVKWVYLFPGKVFIDNITLLK